MAKKLETLASDPDRREAMLRGLAFLERFAPGEACWSACAPDVLYMFFHLATRSRERGLGAFTRRARASAMTAARRWCRENPRLPEGTSATDALWWYAYGAYTATALGVDTRALRRDLAAVVARHRPRDLLGFDPRRGPPPDTRFEPCECGESSDVPPRCPSCGTKQERVHRYQAWQAALVGTHIAAALGIDLGCTVHDAVRWRATMQPYPDVRRRLTWAGWCAFYAVTHLVYVLDEYSLYRLPPRAFGPEIDFVRAACRHGLAEDDVEVMGESVDVLLALSDGDEHDDGANGESDPLVAAARSRLVRLQNRDGSWGQRDGGDEPYTRFHKTWVALDGLTRYGRRTLVRPAWPDVSS